MRRLRPLIVPEASGRIVTVAELKRLGVKRWRLYAGDTAMQMVREAWERPIRRLLRAEAIPDDYFEGALFLFNMMFDPRELLDLHARDLPMDTVLAIMKDAYLGALRGWHQVGTSHI